MTGNGKHTTYKNLVMTGGWFIIVLTALIISNPQSNFAGGCNTNSLPGGGLLRYELATTVRTFWLLNLKGCSHCGPTKRPLAVCDMVSVALFGEFRDGECV